MARASPALSGFVQAFSHPSTSITAATIPAFLAPAIVQERRNPKGTQRLKYLGSRRHASVTASQYSTENSIDSHANSKRGLPLEVEGLVSSPRRIKPAAWATAIESYLPQNLHQGPENTAEEVIQHEVLRPIHTLPEVLSMARSYCKADLLSYIGVYQERWEVVIWLVKAMMGKYPGHIEMERSSSQLPPLLWRTAEQSLDEVTGNAIQVEMPQPSDVSGGRNGWYGRLSLDQYPWPYMSDRWDDPHILRRKSLGQIWQSLGTMILQAADRPAEDSSYSVIMSHVFQILGHLHRINALPDSIYNYAPPTDPTVLQRPPTLHLLSRRIMSTLSDVEWGLQWEETIAKAMSQGYELPKVSVQPKIREFGPELWLDLVLWACVEGGWVSEGAWIVNEMERRTTSKDARWSTISWPEICEMKAPKLDWTSILRLEIDKTRLNQVGGIGIATGTNSHVEMGARTVSREVILALIDGLLNGPQSTAGGLVMTVVELRRSIIACKSLLDHNHPELESNFMDATILRVFESFGNVKEQPGMLNRFLDLRVTQPKQVTRSSGTKSSAQDQEIDYSAAALGLRHRNLHRFSIDGNLRGSLQTFRKIQSTIDTQREERILTFADELRERLGRGDDVSDLFGDTENYVALIQPPPIPSSILASFIDLITKSRLFDLGNWLLLNEDIDGGLMDPALYSDQNLQPALLRFGTATSDSRLLTKILVELETPFSEPVVHALLRYQVVLGRWSAVEELLEYLKNTPDMAWKPSDATTIAKTILQLEHEQSGNANTASVPRALALVQNLVNGQYNSKADPSQLLPDFSQMRMANQLGRILQTLPGSLSRITTRPAGEDSRAHASADVTPYAFNIILEAIVDRYGSLAGKRLWEQWCRAPNIRKQKQQSRSSRGGRERVVTPTLYMLRSILRPALEIKRALHVARKEELIKTQEAKTATLNHQGDPGSVDGAASEKFRLGDEDQKVLDWGISMYKRFGLSEHEINGEIPGSFPPPGRVKAVQDGDAVDI
ncbi:hypothetical protein HO133_009648 [Letharia lupina]|uniref:Uncharacterized protein n=1 Tax=Letharia lupina TaxID=560253 RepID=A0A8H6FF71_9LECA|nr:uncharacterized protein HO133_009648 [Letharia lupina]KAF6225648.1 hypothetical protein HO133_009648 [Letharia lupina]